MVALTSTSGCCCINLRTSSFIIGYIHLVVPILFGSIILSGIVAMARVAMPEYEERDKDMAVVVMVITAITLIYLLLMLAFTIVLLVGLHKSNRKVLKVYLVAAAIFTLFDFAVFCVGSVEDYITSTIVLRIIYLSLKVCSFLVIRSYYYDMKPPLPKLVPFGIPIKE